MDFLHVFVLLKVNCDCGSYFLGETVDYVVEEL